MEQVVSHGFKEEELIEEPKKDKKKKKEGKKEEVKIDEHTNTE